MAVPDPARNPRLPWWALPAVLLDRIRPGLAERAAEDAAWISWLPRGISSFVMPGIVILIPIAFAIPHALAPTGRPVAQITFQILDLYTESIPFLIAAAVVGLAAPTLGVLFLASHAVADLVAAFIQPLELTPLPTALAGRFVSFWVLYLLVAELPMAVHELRGWSGWRRAGPAGGLLGTAAGAAAAAFFAWTWGIGAPLLLRQVWTWSDLKAQTANAGTPLLDNSTLFGWIIGGAALVLLAARAFGPSIRTTAHVSAEPQGRGSRLIGLAFGVGVPLLLFASVITKPIDAVVLIVAVVLARPISVLVLRRLGLVRLLTSIPRPMRFVAGLILSIGVSYGIVLALGVSTLSNFFAMVVAMAVSYILIRVFLDVDDLAPAAVEGQPSYVAGIGAFIAAATLTWIFAAGPVSADNGVGQTDGWGVPLAAGAAAAGAGGLAAASARKNDKKKPNPPPWYIPDSTAEYFGYDAPPPPKPDPKKQPDWTKKKQPPPGGPLY